MINSFPPITLFISFICFIIPYTQATLTFHSPDILTNKYSNEILSSTTVSFGPQDFDSISGSLYIATGKEYCDTSGESFSGDVEGKIVLAAENGCTLETRARSVLSAGGIALIIVLINANSENVPGFTNYQRWDWNVDVSDLTLPAVEIKKAVGEDLYETWRRGEINNNDSIQLTLFPDANPWIPAFESGFAIFYQVFFSMWSFSLIIFIAIILNTFRQSDEGFQFSLPQSILWMEFGANIIRLHWFAVDPIFLRRIYPQLWTIINLQLTNCIGLVTTVLLALYWFKATNMMNHHWIIMKLVDNFKITFAIVFTFFITLQIISSVLTAVYITAGSDILYFNLVTQNALNIICVVIFIVMGIRVIRSLNRLNEMANRKQNRNAKVMTIEIWVSSIGIILQTIAQILFLTSLVWTPWGWLGITMVGYAGPLTTSTAQVLVFRPKSIKTKTSGSTSKDFKQTSSSMDDSSITSSKGESPSSIELSQD